MLPRNSVVFLLQKLMRQFASRKKNSERTAQIGSVNDGLNFEEEDPVTSTDEESEDEGKKTDVAVILY